MRLWTACEGDRTSADRLLFYLLIGVERRLRRRVREMGMDPVAVARDPRDLESDARPRRPSRWVVDRSPRVDT